MRALSHVLFFFSTLVRCGEYRSQTGIQRKLNFVSVRTIKEGSSSGASIMDAPGPCRESGIGKAAHLHRQSSHFLAWARAGQQKTSPYLRCLVHRITCINNKCQITVYHIFTMKVSPAVSPKSLTESPRQQLS